MQLCIKVKKVEYFLFLTSPMLYIIKNIILMNFNDHDYFILLDAPEIENWAKRVIFF